MNFRLLSMLVLMLVFVTAVACQDTKEETSSTVSSGPSILSSSPASPVSSFEVWAVDQSGTSAGPKFENGGLIYIWDGGEISQNASEATPEIIDLVAAAASAGCCSN